MAEVFFDPAVGGDGLTVNDASFRDGGHRVFFTPCLENLVSVAAFTVTQAEAASAFVDDCEAARDAAQLAQSNAEDAADAAAVSQAAALVSRNQAEGFADDAAASAASIDANDIVHAPGSGLANEAGTAYAEDSQTDEYDSTAGRLAKIAAFGGYGRLSSSPLEVYPLTDMNSNPNTVPAGKYEVGNVLGTLNMPFPASPPNAFGLVEVIPQSVNNRVILKATDGGDVDLSGAGDVYERIWWLGSWLTPWKKIGEAKYRDVVGGISDAPVMAEGYGGLGAVAPVWPNSDLFDTAGLVPNSTYRYAAVANQPTNAYGEVVYIRGAGGETLIATVSAHSNASSPSLYIARKTSNGEWSGWSHQYGTHNAVGIVSQSGGVPTGAVIERGSNSFGSWIKYLDGSMIMFVNREYQINGVLNQALYETDDTPLGTLPQPFVGELYIAGTRSSSRQWVVPRTAGFFRVYSIFSITAPLYIQFTIHTRWY